MKYALAGKFTGVRWDEIPYHELEGTPKLARAAIENQFEGQLEGRGLLEYLLVYTLAGPVIFTGIERIEATLSGAAGSFVMQHDGEFKTDEGVNGTLSVVPGSGCGIFQGVTGTGRISSRPGEHHGSYELFLTIP